MAGYIIVDVKTRKIVGICAGIALLLFGIGILIGYFSGYRKPTKASCTVAKALSSSCPISKLDPIGRTYFDRYVEKSADNACVRSAISCLDHGLPRHYIAYHLNDKAVKIDGRLDEEAWNEVPWTEDFVDMRSDVYPAPRFTTKAKIRWDDQRLYVGAYLEETDLWATYTEPDSPVYQENGFELLMDVDGTMHNYKQVQINVLGTVYDLMHKRSPYDANKMKTVVRDWSADVLKAVHAEGTVNKPGDKDKFWSVEMSFSLEALFRDSDRSAKLFDGESWFFQFGRSEWTLNATNNTTYTKSDKVDWWSWQPCGAINLHLQDRWGLVQFKKDINDKQFSFQKWHIYRALIDMLNGLKSYRALNGRYITQIEELTIPPYLLSEVCVEIPTVSLVKRGNDSDFEVTVKSKLISHAPAHIRSDRYVWFE